MNFEEIREYCMNMKGVTESFPFDNHTLVFKVMGKMYALASLEKNPPSINLKCDPDKALELRVEYSGVTPGYHMNKQHWNTVIFDGSFDENLAKEWIVHSYNLVSSRLTKKLKSELADL
ncbi:MAG: putative DNA-binding protein (MmcQ/YjbR family) [Flavobacteriales bacterium]|jgi:predicted DNA-binding protein (MmcQ/YjbR family)